MPLFLGLDTSNYTTSAAVVDSESGEIISCGKLLPVAEGQLGLRQSDAVFSHIKALPDIIAQIKPDKIKNIAAIGVSTRPRPVEGSYMPCFTVGKTVAGILGHALGVPVYEFSHQEGHIAAVLYAAERMDILRAPHLAWHLSGGTTELTYVKPAQDSVLSIEKIGGTSDISAGQLIDRIGVSLGLRFPAGKELELLAEGSCSKDKFSVKLNGLTFSLSGMENQAKARIDKGEDKHDIARFVIETVAQAVFKCTKKALEIHGDMPVVLSGGVAGNRALRRALEEFSPICAQPKYSSDNAVGAAVLASEIGGRK